MSIKQVFQMGDKFRTGGDINAGGHVGKGNQGGGCLFVKWLVIGAVVIALCLAVGSNVLQFQGYGIKGQTDDRANPASND